ncbi:MAG: hypothetical protein CMP10_21560 [Zetaproteobacteria bacterium]|nr:hypothetical protein [Pseudobdellovibrionaceae bacterium]
MRPNDSRKSHMHHKSQDSSGSVWTSFSDLFTSLAIIFLIMFVVVGLKHSLAKFQSLQVNKQYKDFVEGKVPQEDRIRAQESEVLLEDSLAEMESVQKVIEERSREIADFTQQMESHRNMVENILRDQKNKSAAYEAIEKSAAEKDVKISEQQENVMQLNEMIEKLQNNLQNRERKITDMTSEVKQTQGLKSKVEKLNSVISDQKNILANNKQVLTENNQTIENLNLKIANSDATVQSYVHENDSLKQKIKELRSTVREKNMALDTEKSTVRGLDMKLNTKLSSNKALGVENGKLKDKLSDISNIVVMRDEEIKKLNDDLVKEREKTGELDLAVKDREKNLKLKDFANQDLNKELTDLSAAMENKDDEIKKLQTQSYHKKLRKKIATKMADRFKNLGIDVALDKKTGKIYLRSDESYLFANASSALQKEMEDKLQTVIPVYAEELLGDPKISHLITEINIVGHASPSYKKQPVDPHLASGDAYKFNLKLSLNRANAVADYVFDKEFGSFQNKNQFRRLVSVSGVGFSKPIHKQDTVGKNYAPGRCGVYDCKMSRRVEIGFGLREDISGVKELLSH